MGLLTYMFILALTTDPLILRTDSLRQPPTLNPNSNKQEESKVDKMSAIEGAKLEYINDKEQPKAIKVKFDTGILFACGESTLNDDAKNALAKLAAVLIKNPSTKIDLIGHTDNTGSLDLNQKLSEDRAQSVANYLVTQHLNAGQLKEITGKNYSEPVADNATKDGRAANRNVEVYIDISSLDANTLIRTKLTNDTLLKQAVPEELKKMVEQLIKPTDTTNDVELEIDGLLVDDTKTKTGKEFYDLFYSGWEANTGVKNYSITISEKPFRLSSTMIMVSINEMDVYQEVLQPRLDILEAQSQEAIAIIQNYLANIEEIRKQLNGDDMGGSGIY